MSFNAFFLRAHGKTEIASHSGGRDYRPASIGCLADRDCLLFYEQMGTGSGLHRILVTLRKHLFALGLLAAMPTSDLGFGLTSP